MAREFWNATGRFLVFGLFGLLLGAALPAEAFAQEPAAEEKPATDEKPAADEPPADPFAVPDGNPEELLKFIMGLQRVRPAGNSRDEQIEHFKKMVAAISEASDRILAAKPTDDQAEAAVTVKLQGLMLLKRLGIADDTDQLDAFLKKLQDDPRESIRKLALRQKLMSQAMNAGDLDEAQQKALLAEIKAYFAQNKTLGVQDVSLVSQVGNALEGAQANALAAEFYEAVLPQLAASDDPRIKQFGESLAGVVRRLRLPGNPIELDGTFLDGEKLDWAKYRGKVVLVDFWATWCGPCIAEIPNIKKNYDLYHDKGFDVIGISLDDDRKAVEEFVEQQELPWPILYSDSEDAAGWKNPLATRYGINAIPTVILVDQQGKVVSLRARGEVLGEELAKLLGPAEKPKEEKE